MTQDRPQENLYADLTARDQVERIRQTAELLIEDGYISKGKAMLQFADQFENWLPVIRAYEKCRAGDFSNDREGLERAIQKYE